MFNKRNKTRVSFVIQDHVIRFVEVRQGDMEQVHVADEYFLEEGVISEGKIVDRPKLKEVLEEIVKTYQFKKREVLFTVPDAHVVLRKIPYPEGVSEMELQQHLYLEIGTNIILPFEHAVFDYGIYEREGEKDIVLIAAEQSFVNDYADLFEEIGLFPIAADVSIFCFMRLYEYVKHRPKIDEHTLFIQFDIQSAHFSFVHKDTPLLSQHLMLEYFNQWKHKKNQEGFSEYHWTGPMESMEEQIDTMLQSLERGIKFYEDTLNPDSTIQKVILSGDFPYLKKAKEKMEAMSDVPVEIFACKEYKMVDGTTISPQHYLALGLALKEVIE